MTDNFSPDWPNGHVTRDGRRARIICTDRKDANPIVALVEDCGRELMVAYGVAGNFCENPLVKSTSDLLNIPAPKKRIRGWVNVYTNSASVIYRAKASADKDANFDRLACIEIDVEEGHGLT